jgi:hypothetical protein
MYRIYIALLLFSLAGCTAGEDTIPPKAPDLSGWEDTYIISGMDVTYNREITDHIGMPKYPPVAGPGFYSACVPSKSKSGEVVFSDFPLIGCLYAKVNGGKLEFYPQNTEKRPEYIGFTNFMVYPVTEKIMVYGDGSIDGESGNIHLIYDIQGIKIVEFTAGIRRYISPGGYQANIFWNPCE